MRRFVVLVHICGVQNILLVLTTIRILFVRVVVVVFMVGCCDAVVTDLVVGRGTGNNVGAEGAQALAQALENNSTLTTLDLHCTC